MRRDLKPFKFKEFQVNHSSATLAVGTDAVLLGAWVGVVNTYKVLDVGTGCGLIALCVAQRTAAPSNQITAIDIDQLSVTEAKQNFLDSSWSSSLESKHLSFLNLEIKDLDLIISNPPFFRESLKNELEHKVKARHQTEFSMSLFADFCKQSLNTSGRVALVYPSQDLDYLVTLFGEVGLFLSRVCYVKPKSSKGVNRVLVEFFGEEVDLLEESLIIRNEDNSYTDQYQLLTKDFYLNF